MTPQREHPHPVDPERVAAAQQTALGDAAARRLGALLDVVGDPVRARILTALRGGREMCVGDIAIALDVSEDAVSYGLRVLRGHDLVEREPRGRLAYYRLGPGHGTGAVIDALEGLGGPPTGDASRAGYTVRAACSPRRTA